MSNRELRSPPPLAFFSVFIFCRADRRCAGDYYYGYQDGPEHARGRLDTGRNSGLWDEGGPAHGIREGMLLATGFLLFKNVSRLRSCPTTFEPGPHCCCDLGHAHVHLLLAGRRHCIE